MARWKLAAPHYLNVPNTKWEYSETSRSTGKQQRVQLTVPAYLDPRDPADFTHKFGQQAQAGVVADIEGEIIVSRGPSVDCKDIIFEGDPTPDMIPIDAEAEEISASFSERWRYKPEVDQPGGHSQSLIDQFQARMAEVETKPVAIEGLDTLVASIASMVESNNNLVRSMVRRV